MTDELKPCPFCGCEMTMSDSVNYPSPTGEHYYNCPIEGEDIVATEDNWNRRATLSPAHVEDGEEVEVVAYLIQNRDRQDMRGVRLQERTDLSCTDSRCDYMELMTVAQHERIVAALESERAKQWRLRRDFEAQCDTQAAVIAELRAAISAPPAAGVPALRVQLRQYGEADWQVSWVPTDDGLRGHYSSPLYWRNFKPGDEVVLYTAPTPPASEQQNSCPHDSWRYGGGPCGDCGEVQFSEEELLRLNRPASEQQRAVDSYECQGKGGVYEKVGFARPAGAVKAIHGDSGLIVYRDTETGQLYFRDPGDFRRRMVRLNPHLAKGEGV